MHPSEHGVIVSAGLRERLHDVPVLDDLALLKPEEVGDNRAGILGGGFDQPVGDHDVALPHHPLDLDAQLGELGGETVNEGDKRIGAVGCLGVVLDVLRAEVLLDGLLRPLGVECELVVLSHGLLVVLDVAHGGSSPRWGCIGQRSSVSTYCGDPYGLVLSILVPRIVLTDDQ